MSGYSQTIRGRDDAVVRHYEYDDHELLVADFGDADGSVDLVDGSAIVVVGDDHYEFEVPQGAARGIMNNGVVTIQVEDTR